MEKQPENCLKVALAMYVICISKIFNRFFLLKLVYRKFLSHYFQNTYFLDGLGSTLQQNRKRQSRMDKSNWQLAGGPERKHSVLMQLQFNKVMRPYHSV